MRFSGVYVFLCVCYSFLSVSSILIELEYGLCDIEWQWKRETKTKSSIWTTQETTIESTQQQWQSLLSLEMLIYILYAIRIEWRKKYEIEQTQHHKKW